MPDRKRANGLGSKPEQRKDGRFYSNYTVYVRGPKGRVPKLRTVYGKTPTECERNLIRALANRDDGVLLLDSHNPQLADYLPWWLEKVVADTVKQTTWDGYAHMASRHLAPILGHVRLKELDQDHVLDLKSEMLSSGLSNRTVRYAMQTLGKALGYAVVRGTVPANPVRAVKPPRMVKRKLDVWTLKDVLRFFEAANRDRMGPCTCSRRPRACARVRSSASGGATCISTLRVVRSSASSRTWFARRRVSRSSTSRPTRAAPWS